MPGGGGDGAFLVAVVILFFALCWFARLVAYLVCRRRLAYWFAVAPLAGVLVNAAVDANLPMEARWAIAQDDFDRVVREIQAGDHPDVPGRIGMYRVRDVEGVSAGFRFVTHEDFWGMAGFAWFPDGAPSPVTYEHLRGDWYVWGGRGGAD